jgi:hypothetical protein
MKIRKNKKINLNIIAVGFIVTVFFGFSNSVLAANKYWIGNDISTGLIDGWSFFSGGTNDSPVPTLYDDVIFDQGGFDATVDNNFDNANLIVESNYGDIITVNDGVTLTIGSGGPLSDPRVTVSRFGTQIATTTISIGDIDLGGAFVLSAQSGAAVINSIEIKQVGSLPMENIADVSLFYKEKEGASCSNTKPDGSTSFGFGSIDTDNSIVTFEG